MNDVLLGEWLNKVLETLEARRASLPQASTGPARELVWYSDAVKAARSRIETLESESFDKLSVRDELAMRIFISGAALGDNPTLAMVEAFSLADQFLEVRKAPAVPTVPPVIQTTNPRKQYRTVGNTEWMTATDAEWDLITPDPTYEIRIVPAGIVEPCYQFRPQLAEDSWGGWINCDYAKYELHRHEFGTDLVRVIELDLSAIDFNQVAEQ